MQTFLRACDAWLQPALKLKSGLVQWLTPLVPPPLLQPDDLVIDAVAYLVRQHGWFDAKNMVAADASVLEAAADAALVRP